MGTKIAPQTFGAAEFSPYNGRVQDLPDGDSSALDAPSVESIEAAPRPREGTGAIHDADLRAVYERHAAEILRYAIRCTGRREIAEELASEAFLRLHQNRERVDFSRVAAWLTTAVKNLAIDYWRRVEVERRAENLGGSATLQHSGQLSASDEERWEDLLEQPSLKAEHRVCLTLHYVHGMANKEIAGHTGLTENQVKSALQYGLKLLRKAFGAKDELL